MSYTIETRRLERRPYVAVRETVTMAAIGDAMPRLFGALYGWLGRAGVATVGEPWTRYLVMGTDELELEVAAPLAAPLGASGGGDGTVVAGVLPACEVAMTLHVGPYDQLHEAYAAVVAWMQEHGRQPSGAMWEVYQTDPQSEPDPSGWRTLVVAPVLPA